MTTLPKKPLAVSALLSLLLSCVLARSLKDETMGGFAKATDLDREPAALAPYSPLNFPIDSRALADLVDFLLEYRRTILLQQQQQQLLLQEQQQQQQEDYLSKRSWPESGFLVPSSMKRKMFWSPLGQLPASARLGGRPQNVKPSAEDSGSPVFRYG